MLNWLSGAPAATQDFQQVRGVEPVTGGSRAGAGRAAMPVAFLLPDLFGTCLEDHSQARVWPDYDALAKGRFLELRATA